MLAQPFEDGAGRLVKIYSCSVSQCISFLETKPESFAAIELLQRIFLPIQSGNSPDLVKIFVQATTARVIVSVISFVKPWDRTKFLTHLCLSLGRYQTEMDLFCCGNIKQAFFIAGLLPNFPEISRQDVLNILKRYVVEDLRYHPISARQFSRYLKAAMDTLQDVLLDGAAGNYTPCMSEIMLKEQASEQLRAFEATRKSNLIHGLLDDEVLYDYLPPNLEHATMDDPLQWIPTIDPTEGISDEAISEQSKALRLCLRANRQVHDYHLPWSQISLSCWATRNRQVSRSENRICICFEQGIAGRNDVVHQRTLSKNRWQPSASRLSTFSQPRQSSDESRDFSRLPENSRERSAENRCHKAN